jgi:Zn-dependent protease with chaperone function
MPYKPTQFNDAVNVTNNCHKTEFLKLSFAVFIIVLAVYFAFSLISRIVLSNISIESENKLFSKFSYVSDSEKLSEEDDRFIKANTLFCSIPKEMLPVGYKFQLIIIKDKNINAFAIPGGTIALTTGLIDLVKSDRELVFVIGHELGHFANRDHMKSLSGSLAANMTIGLIFGLDNSLLNIANGFSELINNGYSREHELSADSWGLKILDAKYGNTAGAIDFLEMMSKHKSDSRLENFLSTHPSFKTRIQNINNLTKES